MHQVNPKSNNGSLANGTLHLDIDSDVKPTITAEYFVRDNLGIEVLAALPFEHDINIEGLGRVGSTKHLPPVVSLQYHFNGKGKVSPLVGVGVNYTKFFSETTRGALAGGDLSLRGSWGLALHAGPVSYTHLDVYKRQRPRTMPCEWLCMRVHLRQCQRNGDQETTQRGQCQCRARTTTMYFRRQPASHGGEGQQHVGAGVHLDEAGDFMHAIAHPPQQAPQVVQQGKLCLFFAAIRPGTGKASECNQQRTHEGRVGDGARIVRKIRNADQQGKCSQQLQSGTGGLWQPTLLAQAQPSQCRAFQCKHRSGGTRRQRQRNRQRGEAHGQQRIGRAQRRITLALDEQFRQHCLQRTQPQREQGPRHARAVLPTGPQRGLQGEHLSLIHI